MTFNFIMAAVLAFLSVMFIMLGVMNGLNEKVSRPKREYVTIDGVTTVKEEKL